VPIEPENTAVILVPWRLCGETNNIKFPVSSDWKLATSAADYIKLNAKFSGLIIGINHALLVIAIF